LGRITMNPPVSSTVAGDLTTKWRRIAAVTTAVTIDQPVKAATHPELTNPHLLPTRCRLFRHRRVLVAVAGVAEEELRAAAVANGAGNPTCSRAGHAKVTVCGAFALSTMLRSSS
jgi:hypothetical protein